MGATLINAWDPNFWSQRKSVSVTYPNGTGRSSEITEWLHSDAATGGYTRAFMDHGDNTTLTVYFSDSDTAFAFKMRFR